MTATETDATPATLTLYRGDRAAPVAALDEWWTEFQAAYRDHSPPNYRRGDAERILIAAGLAEQYWGRVIIDAERAAGFTPYFRTLTAFWRECAVGKTSAPVKMRKTRDQRVEPADAELRKAGHAFNSAVEADDYLRAAYMLGCIEHRAAALAAA